MIVVRVDKKRELYSTIKTFKVKNNSDTLTEETKEDDDSLY